MGFFVPARRDEEVKDNVNHARYVLTSPHRYPSPNNRRRTAYGVSDDRTLLSSTFGDRRRFRRPDELQYLNTGNDHDARKYVGTCVRHGKRLMYRVSKI